MTQAIEFKQRLAKKPKRFQEFVFVSDSAMKLSGSTTPLQLAHNNTYLDRVEVGQVVTIEQIHTPRDITRQLKSLGFKTGKQVRLLNRTDNGSVIVEGHNTSLGIGKEITRKIVVIVGENK